MRSSLFNIDFFVSKVLNKKVARLNITEIKDICSFRKLYKEELVNNKIEIVVGITDISEENVKFFEDEKYKLVSSKSLYCLEKGIDSVKKKGEDVGFKILTGKDFPLYLSFKGISELVETIGGTRAITVKIWN